MVQTTLFSYFTCNNPKKQTKQKEHSFKQTILMDYFNILPKKKNLILNYFKLNNKEEKLKEKKPLFELVLIDIKNTNIISHIHCIKKNMYEEDLKYIAISYRWGELNEQLLQTPDYTAQITSFRLFHLIQLCSYIKNEPDLKDIPYLWVDAISVDQKHHARKKETILKMNQVYKRASYILAIPDLHRYHLMKNTAIKHMMELISKYKTIVYDALSIYHNNDSSILMINENDINDQQQQQSLKEINYEELIKVYGYLAYLIEDWSNRAWVISEYQIAKKKQELNGTPLKYMFISLLSAIDTSNNKRFFSYFFDQDDERNQQDFKKNKLTYKDVDDHASFIQFLKIRLTQRSHLDMILNSNAARNEDRFNAILPTWDKYYHLIKNRNTISEWTISDMTSVRLKLYGFLNDDKEEGLWLKATLLYACLQTKHNTVILPSFASYHHDEFLKLIEKENENEAHGKYKKSLLLFLNNRIDKNHMEESIQYYITRSERIYTENMISICLNHHYYYYLSVKSTIYFIYKLDNYHLDQKILSYFFSSSSSSMKKKEGMNPFYFVMIPFYHFNLPDYIHIPPIHGTHVSLLGDYTQNKWILFRNRKLTNKFNPDHYCSNNYTFKIY